MGGTGSGSWRAETKTEVEACHIISCAWLLQNHYLDWADTVAAKLGGIIFKNILGDPIYTLSLEFRRVATDELRLALAQTCQIITLKALPLRLGGVRWWFHCPRCDRRSAKLYVPRGGSFFACRICHNLTYRSCNTSGQKIMGYTTHQLAKGLKEINWFRYPPWRRRRDRRPDYRDRGAWMREIVGNKFLL